MSNAMTSTPDPIAVDAIVAWAQRLSTGQTHPRQNVRVLFSDETVAEAVRGRLDALSSSDVWYVVRKSSDDDAVTLRHGRPRLELPSGVTEKTPVLYVVFWIPSAKGHADNAQSLADLRAVGLQDFLGDLGLELALERKMTDRCVEAAAAWGPDRDRAAHHLSTAWQALREVLRAGRGGRERSIPFVNRLEDYAEYLRRAVLDDAAWAAVPPDQRAARLVATWGRALPALEMFRLSELSSLLKIDVDTHSRPGGKPPAKKWRRQLMEILAENLDAASDHGNLAETIKGKGALDEQLERLAKKSELSRQDAEKARMALGRFLHERDLDALDHVEWWFKADAANLRSESRGLKGLLIARKTRTRTSPVDKAADDTQQHLESVAGVEPDPVEAFVEWCRSRVKPADRRAERAQEIADALRAIGQGTAPQLPVDAKSRDVLNRAASAEPDAAQFARVARLWERLGGSDKNAIVKAPTVLLGLARLLQGRLSSDSEAGRLLLDPRPEPGDLLELVVEIGGRRRPLKLNPSILNQVAEREKLRRFLLDDVFRAKEGDDEDDDELDEDEAEEAEDALEITVHPVRGGRRLPALGVLQLSWSSTLRKIVERTNTDAPRCWRPPSAGTGGLGALDALSIFPARDGSEVVYELAAEVLEPWRTFHRCTRSDGDWSRAFAIGPLPAETKSLVEAYLDALRGDPNDVQETLSAKFDALLAAGRLDELKALTMQGAGKPQRTQPPVRALLKAWTGARWATASDGTTLPARLYLTPFHPMVLRSRYLADELLGGLIAELWFRGWPEAAADELDTTLKKWGLPEPVHCYGGFWDGSPLIFDAWIGGHGICAYAPFDSGTLRDHDSLGAADMERVVRRYLDLHPAAGDTLRLRIQGDREGRWAATLMRRLVQKLPSDRRCDIDLVTDLDPRTPSAIEVLATKRSDVANAVEMGDDGSRPRFRYRRISSPADADWCHLSLVLAPSVGAFRPKLETVEEPHEVDTDVWDPSALFALPRADKQDHSVHLGIPRDEAALTVARAITFGAKGDSGIFVERFSFDPAVIGATVRELHRDAHWTVLAAREPIHLAMKAVGTSAAELLDFGASVSRGRQVHHCVSAGSAEFGTDLARLTAMLRQLLGEATLDHARALVREARRFAPGLAMKSASSGTVLAV
ncbi:MAG: hypothetical protein RLP09_17045, partial [Sandaracinaceae bacterium]